MKTLEEKFKKWLDTNPRKELRDIQCKVIAEDLAIGFAEWISEKTTTLGGGIWKMKEDKLFVHKNQLLEIYKKENGL